MELSLQIGLHVCLLKPYHDAVASMDESGENWQ